MVRKEVRMIGPTKVFYELKCVEVIRFSIAVQTGMYEEHIKGAIQAWRNMSRSDDAVPHRGAVTVQLGDGNNEYLFTELRDWRDYPMAALIIKERIDNLLGEVTWSLDANTGIMQHGTKYTDNFYSPMTGYQGTGDDIEYQRNKLARLREISSKSIEMPEDAVATLCKTVRLHKAVVAT
jgi:hypothetical protein